MKNAIALTAAIGWLAIGLPAQERPVPKDSARVSIPGCATGSRVIVGRAPSLEPVRSDIAPGRRFRLNGKKDLINEIKRQQGSMIEVTGLVRQSDLREPGGVSIGGVRLGGGPPQAGAGGRSNIGTVDAVLDVESWRPLAESCPRQ